MEETDELTTRALSKAWEAFNAELEKDGCDAANFDIRFTAWLVDDNFTTRLTRWEVESEVKE